MTDKTHPRNEPDELRDLDRVREGHRGLAASAAAARFSLSIDGKTVATYHLEGAWVAKIEIGALKDDPTDVL